MEDSTIQLTSLTADRDLLLRIFNKLPGMVAYWDTEQRCKFANADYEKWFGVNPRDLIGKTLSELLGPIYPLNRPYILGALRGEAQTFQREIPDPAGAPPRFSQANYVPDVVDGVVRGFIVLVPDISPSIRLERQLREAQEHAREMATHDYLTGLPNRFLFEDRLARAIEVSSRQQRHFAVTFLDLDGFKNINDTYGHRVGDKVLCEVAKRLTGSVREMDTVSRMGGDEFLIMLPEVGGADQSGRVATKILDAMAQTPFNAGDQSLTLTFSIGIAIYPEHGSNSNELITHADKALYGAKRAGKNRFAMFTPGRTA